MENIKFKVSIYNVNSDYFATAVVRCPNLEEASDADDYPLIRRVIYTPDFDSGNVDVYFEAKRSTYETMKKVLEDWTPIPCIDIDEGWD